MSTVTRHSRRRSAPRSRAPSRALSVGWLGVAGWMAKGVLYLLIGVLAVQLALSGGADGEPASKQGAMQSLVDKPFGTVLLALVVVGLFAYAAYMLLSIALRSHPASKAARGWLKDAGRLGSAVAYCAFGVQGISILRGRGQGGGEGSARTWSATLLSSPAGTVLLLAVGIGFIAFGGSQIYRGATRRFMRDLRCPAGSHPRRATIEKWGTVGLVARGVVAGLIGIFVVVSVQRHDPNEVRGIDGTLRTLQAGTAGPPLLLVVALGLVAYGVFALISSRCRRHELG